MTAVWKPPTERRERILLFGTGGVGKSEALREIARHLDGTMSIIDTDFAWDVLNEDGELENVEVWDTGFDPWLQTMDALVEIKKEAGADDCLAIDSISPTWPAVQDWYTQQVFSEDLGDYFLKARAANTSATDLQPFDGWTDWNVINKQYAKLIREILSFPGHVVMTAEQGAIGDSKEMKATFSSVGVKPVGNKRLIHVPHTVLLLKKSRVGEWQMTTVKDRRRKELDNQNMAKGFAMEYLWKIAGWRP